MSGERILRPERLEGLIELAELADRAIGRRMIESFIDPQLREISRAVPLHSPASAAIKGRASSFALHRVSRACSALALASCELWHH